MSRWLFGGLLIVLIYLKWPEARVTLEAGIMAPALPQQTTIKDPVAFAVEHYVITPLAEFEITAKVLSRERYRFDKEADLSPIDFALGWQRMSDEAVLQHFSVKQGHRWFHWQADQLPIPQAEIAASAANMHLIPADDFIRAQLLAVKQGRIVTLEGQLVEVRDTQEQWHWRSSLTRNDTGAGACEIIWVKQVTLLDH